MDVVGERIPGILTIRLRAFADDAARVAPGSAYSLAAAAVAEFVAADLAWQDATLAPR